MEIAGYQSDIKTTTVITEDNYTAEKSIAEFGVTTGTVNKYELALNPKLSKPYEPGLRLQVRFHKTNTGAITLNVDGKGAVPVVKLQADCSEGLPDGGSDNGGSILDVRSESKVAAKGTSIKAEVSASRLEPQSVSFYPLETSDISTLVHYILVYDGKQFQVVNSFPECTVVQTTDPTIPPTDELFLNRQEYLEIKPEHIGARMFYTPGRNRYAAVNGNLIVARDIRLKIPGGPGSIGGFVLKLPKPLDPSLSNAPGFVQSLQGENFYYEMNDDGVVRIQGELKDVNDEINFNFYPYIAKYPLEYDTETTFTTAKATTVKTASKTMKTTAKTIKK